MVTARNAAPRPARRRGGFRRACITAHLWLGITVGLLWALQGLTGALLVFHREADRIGGAALTDAPMLPVGQLIAAAERAAHRPLQRLTAVSNDPRLVEARFLDAHNHLLALELDAATGRVVGHRDRDPASPFTGSAWRWIYLLHISLVAGPTGRVLIGISGLVLAATLAMGLYVGWPARRQWRAAFAVRRWKVAVQKLYGWHRAVGLAGGFALLVMALTGSYMTFAGALAPAIGRLVPFESAGMMAHMTAGQGDATGMPMAHVTPDAAMAIARARFPVGRFMNLELPREHPAYYSIRFTLREEWRHWSGRAMVQVDPVSGRVLATYDPRRVPIANRIDDRIYPVHLGEAGGLLGRLLVLLAGLSLPTLYVTGLLRWLRRRRTAVGSGVPRKR